MIQVHFIHLFKYNDWATKEAVNSISGHDKKDERIVELLSHIVSAQRVWLNRILARETHLDPWEKHSVEECTVISTAVTSEWINFLEGKNEEDLEKRIEYKNLKGEHFTNTIKDILTHVINHSTYHRAQIAQKVKLLGGKPAVTDYIFYQRKFNK